MIDILVVIILFAFACIAGVFTGYQLEKWFHKKD